MNLSKNFTLKELSVTQTGLKNDPPVEAQQNLKCLCCKVLQPLRDEYGKPIQVNSGYRSKEVNTAIGGAKSSQHMLGQAADITTFSRSGNKRLFELIQSLELPFDQLIDERDFAWIHVSYSPRHRRQILHLK